MITLNQPPVVQADMLIRKPAAEVFEAFVNPEVTTKFWFTNSSGRLEAGKRVRWAWEMYGVGTDVEVKEIAENERIVIEWSTPVNTVEWTFISRGEHETMVSITNSGFTGSGDEIVGAALDSTGGFTMVLCAAKAYLEHNIMLNVVADKAPDAHVNSQ